MVKAFDKIRAEYPEQLIQFPENRILNSELYYMNLLQIIFISIVRLKRNLNISPKYVEKLY